MTANDPGHINNLSENQKELLKRCWIDLINAISKEHSLTNEEITDSIYGDELFCAVANDNPDVVLLRWLRGNKWDVDVAVDKLLNTLKWRHETNVNQILKQGENEILQKEMNTGKAFILGKDKQGRPVTYVQVKNHIKGQFSDESTQLLTIFTIETGRKLLESGIETATIILDLEGFSMKNIDYQLVKFFIHLLENHYPESLGLALVINASLLFISCWNIIKYWLDPVVLSKIQFLDDENDLHEYIDSSVLPKRLNGFQLDYQYIPPTENDQQIISDFRNDKYGENIARKAHRCAAKNYLNLTLQWANNNEDKTIFIQRKKATKKLRKAFEQLIPYVFTQTYYHRQEIIHEPIFNISYERLKQRDQQDFVMF